MGQGRVQSFNNDVKEVSDSWNLRICLIISLFLQGFLMLVPSLRKRCKSNLLHLLIWSAYFLASWIAAYALGQTVKKPGDDPDDLYKSGELSLFSAQFLLLHLAGPDSLTSFSPGDNGFWLKPLFELLCQVGATIYSFYLLAEAKKSKLWIPTVLVFVVGIIKSYERLKALFNAGFDRFGETLLPEPHPGRDYEEAVLVYRAMRGVQGEIQRGIDMHENSGRIKLHDNCSNLLCIANSFFEVFKVLFTGSFLSFQDRETSLEYFSNTHFTYSKAFRIIEYELSLLHDLMHTKLAVVQNTFGYICRFICFSFILAAYILFFKADKQGYAKFDVNLTHALLIGTIFFDIIFLAKLMIFSDWSVIRGQRTRHQIPAFILERKRWSRKIFQYDMLNYCLCQPPMKKLYRFVGCIFNSTGFVDRMRAMVFSSLEKVTEDLEESVFEEIKTKSSNVNDLNAAKKECSARGISALSRPNGNSYIHLKWSIDEFHYLESLLLWHLATELCCHNHSLSAEQNKKVKFCNLLSRYMFYLRLMQPTMLSPEMGNWSIVLQDTQAEAKRVFKKKKISDHGKACQELLKVSTPYRAAAMKGSESKSLFFDAIFLAKELQKLDEQWEVMNRVWVELMCFAAISCSPTIHAQQPSKGGELLTFTWLLMNHLGLGTQFSEQERAHA